MKANLEQKRVKVVDETELDTCLKLPGLLESFNKSPTLETVVILWRTGAASSWLPN